MHYENMSIVQLIPVTVETTEPNIEHFSHGDRIRKAAVMTWRLQWHLETTSVTISFKFTLNN